MTTYISNYYPLIIPLAPLLAAAFNALPSQGKRDGRDTICFWGLVTGFIVSIMTLWQVIQTTDPIHIVLFAWRMFRLAAQFKERSSLLACNLASILKNHSQDDKHGRIVLIEDFGILLTALVLYNICTVPFVFEGGEKR